MIYNIGPSVANVINCYKVKHLSGVPLYGWLLASPPNIRLGRKGLPGTNALAY